MIRGLAGRKILASAVNLFSFVRTMRTGRGARLAHALLFGLIVAGLAAWLHRIYGFEPLAVKEPASRELAP